jgi:hypothetical protein
MFSVYMAQHEWKFSPMPEPKPYNGIFKLLLSGFYMETYQHLKARLYRSLVVFFNTFIKRL